MSSVWSVEVDSILGSGRSLEDVGVKNWALDRSAALSALDCLCRAGVAVLGGDVYIVQGQSLESSYDGWYCDRDHGEDDQVFVERSIAKAKKYIASYPASAGDVLFALVPKI